MTNSITYDGFRDALECLTEARYIEYALPPKSNIDPNAIESAWLRRLAPRQEVDFWRSLSGQVIDRVSEIAGELELQANLSRRPVGGYAVLNRAKRKWQWSVKPKQIAQELNRQRLFVFDVTTGDVYHAQRRLGVRA